MNKREYVISRMGTRIDFGNSLGEAVDDLEECLEAYKETRWIPVSERLPDDRTSILVYHNISGLTDEAWFYKHIRHPLHEYDIDDQYWSDVTHWMPLPEPPETTREDAGHWDGIAPEQEV